MRGLTWLLRDARTASIVVGVVAALVYANSLWNQFAYDDLYIIERNESIQSLGALPDALVQPYWPDAYGEELGLWRPVTTGAFGIFYALGDGSPLIYHVANVLGHAVASVLVLLLGTLLLPLGAAFVAGLVFAVHPVHVEAVANVVGFAEILSTVLMLWACIVHLKSPERSPWKTALGLGLLYAGAFGAKEGGVTLPGLLFLLDAVRQRLGPSDLAGYLRNRWRVYAVLAAVAGATLLGRHAVLGTIASPFAPLGADMLAEIPRIWTLAEVWTHYVRLWVFPLDLFSDYSPNVIPISMEWHAVNITGALVALCVLVTALVTWRRGPLSPASPTARAFGLGVVWFVVAVSPTSNVLFLSGVVLAERTLYVPSVGLALASGWLVFQLWNTRPRAAVGVVAIVSSLLCVRTWTRTPAWHDNQVVFNTLIRDAPHSGRAQWVLGTEFLRAGNVAQAMVTYRLAINILGGHYTVVTDIAQRLVEIERYVPAERLLTVAYAERPEFSLAPSLLAWIRAQYADPIGTERYSRASLALYEPDPARRHLLAWSLAAQGRWDEARAARASADELQVRVRFWHQWMYWALVRRHEGDTLGTRLALDSAWAATATGLGRRTMDSLRVAEFGLAPLLAADSSAAPAR